MKEDNANGQTSCPRIEIAAYIDGELSPGEELDLEMHLTVCRVCAEELNEQKKLLCVLDMALENEIRLPENFTKVVVANAESKVSGLRCARERTRALVVAAALLVIVLIGLGAETSKMVETAGNIGEGVFAVGRFFLHVLHDITFAATVILRSLCFQFVFNSTATVVFLGLFFLLSLFALSGLIWRQYRS